LGSCAASVIPLAHEFGSDELANYPPGVTRRTMPSARAPGFPRTA
jgi:hypothetical protein